MLLSAKAFVLAAIAALFLVAGVALAQADSAPGGPTCNTACQQLYGVNGDCMDRAMAGSQNRQLHPDPSLCSFNQPCSCEIDRSNACNRYCQKNVYPEGGGTCMRPDDVSRAGYVKDAEPHLNVACDNDRWCTCYRLDSSVWNDIQNLGVFFILPVEKDCKPVGGENYYMATVRGLWFGGQALQVNVQGGTQPGTGVTGFGSFGIGGYSSVSGTTAFGQGPFSATVRVPRSTVEQNDYTLPIIYRVIPYPSQINTFGILQQTLGSYRYPLNGGTQGYVPSPYTNYYDTLADFYTMPDTLRCEQPLLPEPPEFAPPTEGPLPIRVRTIQCTPPAEPASKQQGISFQNPWHLVDLDSESYFQFAPSDDSAPLPQFATPSSIPHPGTGQPGTTPVGRAESSAGQQQESNITEPAGQYKQALCIIEFDSDYPNYGLSIEAWDEQDNITLTKVTVGTKAFAVNREIGTGSVENIQYFDYSPVPVNARVLRLEFNYTGSPVLREIDPFPDTMLVAEFNATPSATFAGEEIEITGAVSRRTFKSSGGTKPVCVYEIGGTCEPCIGRNCDNKPVWALLPSTGTMLEGMANSLDNVNNWTKDKLGGTIVAPPTIDMRVPAAINNNEVFAVLLSTTLHSWLTEAFGGGGTMQRLFQVAFPFLYREAIQEALETHKTELRENYGISETDNEYQTTPSSVCTAAGVKFLGLNFQFCTMKFIIFTWWSFDSLPMAHDTRTYDLEDYRLVAESCEKPSKWDIYWANAGFWAFTDTLASMVEDIQAESARRREERQRSIAGESQSCTDCLGRTSTNLPLLNTCINKVDENGIACLENTGRNAVEPVCDDEYSLVNKKCVENGGSDKKDPVCPGGTTTIRNREQCSERFPLVNGKWCGKPVAELDGAPAGARDYRFQMPDGRHVANSEPQGTCVLQQDPCPAGFSEVTDTNSCTSETQLQMMAHAWKQDAGSKKTCSSCVAATYIWVYDSDSGTENCIPNMANIELAKCINIINGGKDACLMGMNDMKHVMGSGIEKSEGCNSGSTKAVSETECNNFFSGSGVSPLSNADDGKFTSPPMTCDQIGIKKAVANALRVAQEAGEIASALDSEVNRLPCDVCLNPELTAMGTKMCVYTDKNTYCSASSCPSQINGEFLVGTLSNRGQCNDPGLIDNMVLGFRTKQCSKIAAAIQHVDEIKNIINGWRTRVVALNDPRLSDIKDKLDGALERTASIKLNLEAKKASCELELAAAQIDTIIRETQGLLDAINGLANDLASDLEGILTPDEINQLAEALARNEITRQGEEKAIRAPPPPPTTIAWDSQLSVTTDYMSGLLTDDRVVFRTIKWRPYPEEGVLYKVSIKVDDNDPIDFGTKTYTVSRDGFIYEGYTYQVSWSTPKKATVAIEVHETSGILGRREITITLQENIEATNQIASLSDIHITTASATYDASLKKITVNARWNHVSGATNYQALVKAVDAKEQKEIIDLCSHTYDGTVLACENKDIKIIPTYVAISLAALNSYDNPIAHGEKSVWVTATGAPAAESADGPAQQAGSSETSVTVNNEQVSLQWFSRHIVEGCTGNSPTYINCNLNTGVFLQRYRTYETVIDSALSAEGNTLTGSLSWQGARALVAAIATQETDFGGKLVGDSGDSFGLMQVSTRTGNSVCSGLSYANTNPGSQEQADNIKCGVRILNDNYKTSSATDDAKLRAAIKAYNPGRPYQEGEVMVLYELWKLPVEPVELVPTPAPASAASQECTACVNSGNIYVQLGNGNKECIELTDMHEMPSGSGKWMLNDMTPITKKAINTQECADAELAGTESAALMEVPDFETGIADFSQRGGAVTGSCTLVSTALVAGAEDRETILKESGAPAEIPSPDSNGVFLSSAYPEASALPSTPDILQPPGITSADIPAEFEFSENKASLQVLNPSPVYNPLPNDPTYGSTSAQARGYELLARSYQTQLFFDMRDRLTAGESIWRRSSIRQPGLGDNYQAKCEAQDPVGSLGVHDRLRSVVVGKLDHVLPLPSQYHTIEGAIIPEAADINILVYNEEHELVENATVPADYSDNEGVFLHRFVAPAPGRYLVLAKPVGSPVAAPGMAVISVEERPEPVITAAQSVCSAQGEPAEFDIIITEPALQSGSTEYMLEVLSPDTAGFITLTPEGSSTERAISVTMNPDSTLAVPVRSDAPAEIAVRIANNKGFSATRQVVHRPMQDAGISISAKLSSASQSSLREWGYPLVADSSVPEGCSPYIFALQGEAPGPGWEHDFETPNGSAISSLDLSSKKEFIMNVYPTGGSVGLYTGYALVSEALPEKVSEEIADNALYIAPDSQNSFIYYTSSDGKLRSVSAAGVPGISSTIGANPGGLALDDENIYFAAAGAISRTAKGSFTPSDIARGVGNVTHLAVDSQNIYWIDQQGRIKSAAKSASAANCAGENCVFAQAEAQGIALDARFAYYSEAGSLKRIPKAGGSEEVVYSGKNGISALYADGSSVYAAINNGDGKGKVALAAGDGSDSGPLSAADTAIAVGRPEITSLAVASGNAYWAEAGALYSAQLSQIRDYVPLVYAYQPGAPLISVTPETMLAPAGAEAEYNVRIDNLADTELVFGISLTEVPEGWEISTATRSVSLQRERSSGDSASFSVSVKSPDSALPDDSINWCITANSSSVTGQACASYAISLSRQPSVTWRLAEGYAFPAKPRVPTGFVIIIRNENPVEFAAQSRVRITSDIPESWSSEFVFNDEYLQEVEAELEPQEEVELEFYATPARTAVDGEHSLFITAELDDGVQGTGEIIVPVRGCGNYVCEPERRETRSTCPADCSYNADVFACPVFIEGTDFDYYTCIEPGDNTTGVSVDVASQPLFSQQVRACRRGIAPEDCIAMDESECGIERTGITGTLKDCVAALQPSGTGTFGDNYNKEAACPADVEDDIYFYMRGEDITGQSIVEKRSVNYTFVCPDYGMESLANTLGRWRSIADSCPSVIARRISEGERVCADILRETCSWREEHLQLLEAALQSPSKNSIERLLAGTQALEERIQARVATNCIGIPGLEILDIVPPG